ncbi:MAG: DUF1631 family protein, partial [Proteobacteria bacterium]
TVDIISMSSVSTNTTSTIESSSTDDLISSGAETSAPPVIEPIEPETATPISPTQQAIEPEVAETPVSEEANNVAVEPLVPIGATLESLETFVVVSDEPIIAVGVESLPEGDQHLSLVGNLTQGSWFEMQSEDGQKFRSRLAAIIRATGKYIFVNRSGVKVAEETRMSLALALKSGRLQVLDDGMLFDRALEAVIGNLRNNR